MHNEMLMSSVDRSARVWTSFHFSIAIKRKRIVRLKFFNQIVEGSYNIDLKSWQLGARTGHFLPFSKNRLHVSATLSTLLFSTHHEQLKFVVAERAVRS